MNTPIFDFIQSYKTSGFSRLHMPGHKGKALLGPEAMDITEIKGADALYEAEDIIAESEENASRLFGSGKTLYSTEGSSQCIRAMLYLAMMAGESSTIVAARNVHKAFVYAAALLDLDVVWLWPEGGTDSLCSCQISAETLDKTLNSLDAPPAAVYLTSPDYLGVQSDLNALADICHKHGTILAVDNAHGAYLHFLPCPAHPLDLGADICCDSAHKTLPVLTGGAYLHINQSAEKILNLDAKAALALFGSTSPSYLILASLDLCNAYLNGDYTKKLVAAVETISGIKHSLSRADWKVLDSDPLRITIKAASDITGMELAEKLRRFKVECEYADPDHIVLMPTEFNEQGELLKIVAALGVNQQPYDESGLLPQVSCDAKLSIRKAVFSSNEKIKAADSLGRICASPTVSCPPAIPIVISGEEITKEAIELFEYYDIHDILVVK